MKHGFLLLLLVLGACAAVPAPLTTAQTTAAGRTAAIIRADANAVEAACAEAMPIAALAGILPVVGTYVALGVQVGCGTADGLAKLVADPSSAQWLGQQIEIMKTALGAKS